MEEENTKSNGGFLLHKKVRCAPIRAHFELKPPPYPFKSAALTQFGSVWAWLVYKANRLDVGNTINPRPSEMDNKLVVTKTPNAVNPLLWDYSPLLAINVWEHAYYLDYENRKADYVSIFLDKLVSRDIVSSRLDSAVERAAEIKGG